MKSASNRGILKSSPPGVSCSCTSCCTTGYRNMSQLAQTNIRAELPSGKLAHHLSAAVDLPVQSLNDIVGTDAGLAFTGKALSILTTSFTLKRGLTENTLRKKWMIHRWYLASGNTSPMVSSASRHLSPTPV